MQPLVSVLIATYNNDDRIERAIRTAYEQAYFKSEFEVVVFDDGSDDDT